MPPIRTVQLGPNLFPQISPSEHRRSDRISRIRLKTCKFDAGIQVYGAHLAPFKTPSRETDANHMPPEFNVDQQDFLVQRQKGNAWTWPALRPSLGRSFSLGNPMNLAMVIAIYASISKEFGLPLRFPGKPGAYDSL